jgi:hypothetical protein
MRKCAFLKHQKARKMHWNDHKMTLKRDIRDEAQKRRNTTECDKKRRVAVCIWKDTGGLLVGRRNFSGCRIREQSALDNPRADVYNKDKERRCPHSGQLPSSDVTLENMTAVSW